MPLRASHALSYKQTLAAILKFPITSFMPPLGRHLLLIEDRLTSCARGRNASPTSVAYEPRADDMARVVGISWDPTPKLS